MSDDQTICPGCGRQAPHLGKHGCVWCLADLAATLKSDQANERLLEDSYDLIAVLGKGSGGTVWHARERRIGAERAVKRLHPVADLEAQKRFLREARIIASLDHPHIVRILDHGIEEDAPWYSMDLYRGGSLADACVRQLPPSRVTAEWIRQIADAVEHAHSHGIIHRDIKPENIVLDGSGEARLTDFGIARHVGSKTRLTLEQRLVGTPAFMSPEQATGVSEIGPASDIYNLGAVLYYCLTGKPPFLRQSLATTLEAIENQVPVHPREHNPEVPNDLATICLKCLEKSSARRYASAAELRNDLDRWLTSKPILARPAPLWLQTWLWCLRHPARATAAGLATILVLSLATAVILLRQQKQRIVAADVIHRKQLARQTVQLAQQEIHDGRAADAVARLAYGIREHPESAAVRDNFLAALLHHDFPELRRTIATDFDRVTAVHHHTNQPWLAVIGQTRNVTSLRAWHSMTGVPLGPPTIVEGQFSFFEFVPGTSFAVIARRFGQKSGFCIWNVATSSIETDWKFVAELDHVNVAPNGKILLVSSRGNHLQSHHLPDGSLATNTHFQSRITSAAFRHDSTQVALGFDPPAWGVFDASTLKPNLGPHDTARVFTDIAFNMEERSLAVSEIGSLDRLDAVSGKRLSTRAAHAVNGIMAMCPDRVRMTIQFPDAKSLLVHSTLNLEKKWGLSGYSMPNLPVKPFSPDGLTILALKQPFHRELHFLETESGVQNRQPILVPKGIRHFCWTANGEGVAVIPGDNSGNIQMWSCRPTALRPEPIAGEFLPSLLHPRTTAPTASDTILLSVSELGTSALWDLQAGKPAVGPFHLPSLRGQPVVAANGKKIFLQHVGDPPAVWVKTGGNWTSQGPLGKELSEGLERLANLTMSADGSQMAGVLSVSNQLILLEIWDLEKGMLATKINSSLTYSLALAATNVSLRFSPSGRWISMTTRDHGHTVCNAITGATRLTRPGAVSRSGMPGFAPDERYVAVPSDLQVVVYSLEDGSDEILTHETDVDELKWIANDRLLTFTSDGRVSIWNTRTSTLLGNTTPVPHPKLHISISGDGTRFLIIQPRKSMQLYDTVSCLPVGGSVPIRSDHAQLNSDGTMAATISSLGVISHHFFPAARSPLPETFATCAEALVGRQMMGPSGIRPVPSSIRSTFRSQLDLVHAESNAVDIVRWLQTDPKSRAAHPRASLTRDQEVRIYLESRTIEGARAACRLLPGNAEVTGVFALVLARINSDFNMHSAGAYASMALSIDPTETHALQALTKVDAHIQENRRKRTSDVSPTPTKTTIPVELPPLSSLVTRVVQVPIDPAATYLRADPRARRARPINLFSIGIRPGDWIELRPIGSARIFHPMPELPMRLTAAFSASSTLLGSPSPNGSRIPDLIPAVASPITTPDVDGSKITDIDGDFACNGTPVQVPERTTHLFVSTIDSHFGDNKDPDEDLQLEIRLLKSDPEKAATPVQVQRQEQELEKAAPEPE